MSKPNKHSFDFALIALVSIVLIFCFSTLSGCATMNSAAAGLTSTQAQQDMYLVESDYAAALRIAVAYRDLPACQPGLKICADATVLADIRAVNAAADVVLFNSEAVVRSKSTSAELANAITAAKSAVAELTALTSKVKVR